MKNAQGNIIGLSSTVLAIVLMTGGCTQKDEQPKPIPTDEPARSTAEVEKPAPTSREDTTAAGTAKDLGDAASTSPTSMGQLLNQVDERIESDDEYGATEEKEDQTDQLKPDQDHKTYAVKSGDSLASIARAHYGDPAMYMAIYEENQDILPDPNSLEVGQVLELP